MSARRNKTTQAEKEVAKLRSELEELKAQTRAAEAADVAAHNIHSHEFDQLTPTEQSAASLGVSPTAWKPISFLNNAHYAQLIKANMLDDSLARRIEVSFHSLFLRHVCTLTFSCCVFRHSRPSPRPLLKMAKTSVVRTEGCVESVWLM